MTPSVAHSADPREGAPSQESDDEIMLRRRKHAQIGSAIEGLNLTAMMDIMTIILVFLIKQFESAPQNISLNDDLMLPSSSASAEMVPAVSLILSKKMVMVDSKPVLDAEGNVLVLSGQMTPAQWANVGAALTLRREFIQAVAARGGAPFDGVVMVVADEDTQYEHLTKALYQAGREAKFTSFRLILRSGGTPP